MPSPGHDYHQRVERVDPTNAMDYENNGKQSLNKLSALDTCTRTQVKRYR